MDEYGRDLCGVLVRVVMIFEKYPGRVCLIVTPDDRRRPKKSSLVACAKEVVDIIMLTVVVYSARFSLATSNNAHMGRHFVRADAGSTRVVAVRSIDDFLVKLDMLYPGVKCSRCPVWTSSTGATCVECSCL